MKTLNADGTPRKKYTTRKMIIKKNRKNGQKKAWDTRRALYPETNGYKPQQVEDKPKLELHEAIAKVFNEEATPAETKEEAKVDEKVIPLTLYVGTEVAERINNLDDFLNSIPGVEFNRDEFVREALSVAVDTIFSGVGVVVTGEEKIINRLKGMMEFMEKEV